MNFPPLALNSYGVYSPGGYFTVTLTATTSGRPYKITQTCAGVVNAANGANLNKSFTMAPYYDADYQLVWPGQTGNPPAQGPQPTGSSPMPAPSLAVGANLLIYSSDPAGISKMISCAYGFATGNTDSTKGSVDPASAVALTNANAVAGSYSGAITFSVVLK